MAGYSAMARIEGGHVRALAWDGRAPGADGSASAARASDDGTVRDQQPVPTLRERLAWWREELGMMTFFLLDPESWR